MKRILYLLLCFYICASLASAADFNGFFVLDRLKDLVEIYDGAKQLTHTFKTGPQPVRVLKNSSIEGYVLMYRGRRKTPGGLTFLDPHFQPTAVKELPGTVIQDFYLKENGLWLLFTVTPNKAKPTVTLTFFDLNTQETTALQLEGIPSVYRFNADRTELAIGALGNTKNNVSSALFLIDLVRKQARSFSISTNPGAIYYTDSSKIMVACGGYRKTQKYPEEIVLQKTESPEPAKLHWIDAITGQNEIIRLDFSPLVIIQDQQDSAIFYVACSNIKETLSESTYIKIFDNNNSDPNQPTATLYKINSGKITARLSLQSDPRAMFQSSCGTVCVLGKEELHVIEVQTPILKILQEYKYDLETEEFLLNQERTTGYLTNINSNYLQIIDLSSGNLIKRLKIGKSFNLSSLKKLLFNKPIPPVVSASSIQLSEPTRLCENQRMFFSKDFLDLYALTSGSEASIIDLKNNEVKSTIRFFGFPSGIHPTPNQRYITVRTENGWYLLDPSQTKPILSLSLQQEDSNEELQNGYYSPDGNLLIIPFKSNLYFINPIIGKSLGKTRTKTTAPTIVWLE